MCWGYQGLVVGELGSDVAMWPWFQLVGFLCFPFAIWLSLVLVGIVVSGWSVFLCGSVSLCPYSSELKSESPAGRFLSPGGLCTEGCGVSWCKWRWEDFCPSCSTDLRPCVLLAGPLQREGGDLTSVLRSESTAE